MPTRETSQVKRNAMLAISVTCKFGFFKWKRTNCTNAKIVKNMAGKVTKALSLAMTI